MLENLRDFAHAKKDFLNILGKFPKWDRDKALGIFAKVFEATYIKCEEELLKAQKPGFDNEESAVTALVIDYLNNALGYAEVIINNNENMERFAEQSGMLFAKFLAAIEFGLTARQEGYKMYFLYGTNSYSNKKKVLGQISELAKMINDRFDVKLVHTAKRIGHIARNHKNLRPPEIIGQSVVLYRLKQDVWEITQLLLNSEKILASV